MPCRTYTRFAGRLGSFLKVSQCRPWPTRIQALVEAQLSSNGLRILSPGSLPPAGRSPCARLAQHKAWSMVHMARFIEFGGHLGVQVHCRLAD